MYVDTVLLKVASRCNLDCSYCYVFNMGDEAWRDMPKRMSIATEEAVAAGLRDLLAAQGRPFSIVLHGGEPLLLGEERLRSLFSKLRTAVGYECGISVQTNGVLVNRSILDACSNHEVTMSVSLDGPADVHDRFRIDRRGRATHAAVVAGVRQLQDHPAAYEIFSGILAVVDPRSSPDLVYRYFQALGVPSVDFLYRDGNHNVLPFGKASARTTEYGSWISRILDLYVADRSPFRIRMLDDMIKLSLGGIGVKEGVGLTDYGILIIDTDGSVKKNDTLKSSPLGDMFEGTWSVHEDRLADVAASPAFQEYHRAQRPTSSTCMACPDLEVCGGGMLTHRYKAGSDYDNPTVFCADQLLLISRIRDHVAGYVKPLAA